LDCGWLAESSRDLLTRTIRWDSAATSLCDLHNL
jgi:hypothetical protein